MPQLVATAWTSAGDTSPMRAPGTSPVPIADRIAAIAGAGFCGFGLIADDLVAIRDSIGFTALRDLIADAGLTHVEIELIERWWIPRGQPGHTYAVRDLLFEAADVLSPAFIKIGSENGPPTADPLSLVDPLRELPTQAVAHGTRVAIEPMPFSAIATVPMGAEIVAAAEHPAAGLLVDAWHMFRAGTTLEELRARCSPEMVFGVELDDAATEVVGYAVRGHRRAQIALRRRLVRPSRAWSRLCVTKGFDGPWGVEILSSSFRALPVDQALTLAAESALAVLR